MFSRLVFTLLFILSLFVPGSVDGQDILQKVKNLGRDVFQKKQQFHGKPRTGEDDAIECLASQIDWLENYLDEYGSIVAKQPDIWGESRLTKYRQEVEKEFANRVEEFELRDNASIIRSDISNLASITSVGAGSSSAFANYQQDLNQSRAIEQRQRANYESQLRTYEELLGRYQQSLLNQPTTTAPTTPNAPGAPQAPSIPTFTAPTDLDTLVDELNKGVDTLKAIGEKGLKAESNLEPVIELNQLKRYLDHLNQLRRVNEGDDTSDAPGYALNLVRMPVSILPGRATRRGYGAEVTVTAKPITSIALLPNTFRNLVVNDLVDQLSLPVLRLAEERKLDLAVFLKDRNKESQVLKYQILNLPKFKTADGFKTALREIVGEFAKSIGCGKCGFATKLGLVLEYAKQLELALIRSNEIKTAKSVVEVTAYLKDAFSSEISPPRLVLDTQFQYLAEYLVTTSDENKIISDRNTEIAKSVETRKKEAGKQAIASARKQGLEKIKDVKSRSSYLKATNSNMLSFDNSGQLIFEGIDNLYTARSSNPGSTAAFNFLELNIPKALNKINSNKTFNDSAESIDAGKQLEILQGIGIALQESLESITNNIAGEFASTTATSRSRKSRFPISPAVSKASYGDPQLRRIARHLKDSYKGRHIIWNQTDKYKDQIHLVDAQNFLQECFDSAYDTLSQPDIRSALINTIEGVNGFKSLADLVTLGDTEQVNHVRDSFLSDLESHQIDIEIRDYCWCMVVEMAMLNRRLNEDVHEHAIKKGGCKAGCYFMYYLPLPKCSNDVVEATDPEFFKAANMFCNYVACRWPIHVFTIDPINQEQNVSDASIVRRELSIAAALAFTAGRINLNQLTRFQRQFQEDIATVGLNRTQVGFMHGYDTFGWRFTPRVQSRTPQGNLRAFGETLFGRRTDANWRESALEPGMRECTAIMLMPSFVPYCDFDVRTNWFQITKPTHSDMSMKETMKISRSVTKMRQVQQCCMECAHLYRDQDVERLLNRVEQLEREIPLQTLRAQIPYENTLGGFDLFNNGLTDLGPRLQGWYGAPGVVIGYNKSDEDKKKTYAKKPTSTSLFLVADNLSVNRTQVIAGGLPIDDAKLISREVIQINVPDDAQMVQIDNKNYVAVYIATPYGVTNHLHIPVVTDDVEAAKAKEIADLEKSLLAKIEETPYKWSKKSEIGIEINFAQENTLCNFGGAELVREIDDYELTAGPLKTDSLTGDKREFSIVGVVQYDKKDLAGPFELVSDQTLDSKHKKTWKTADLINEDVRRGIGAKVKSSMFKGENSIKLKMQTYILFKNSEIRKHDNDKYRVVQSFATPVKIGDDLDITVTTNQSCQTVFFTPLPESGDSDAAPLAKPSGETSALEGGLKLNRSSK